MKYQTKWLWALLAALAVLLCLLLGRSWLSGREEAAPTGSVPAQDPVSDSVSSDPAPARSEAAEDSSGSAQLQTSGPGSSLYTDPAPSGDTAPTLATESQSSVIQDPLAEYGLALSSVGSYTGVYMEDGTDEPVSGVAMAVVSNLGEETIQYAELVLTSEQRTLRFSLSTLPPGSSIVLLELDRQEYLAGESLTAELHNVALFSQPLSCQEDRLEFQLLDGAVNIVNRSGEDITGEIILYYKNQSQDMLCGGITYRIRLQDGLKAGEIRQIMASHLTSSSRIMFVTIG